MTGVDPDTSWRDLPLWAKAVVVVIVLFVVVASVLVAGIVVLALVRVWGVLAS